MASVNSDAQTWIRAYQISRTQNFRSEGRRRPRPRSRSGARPGQAADCLDPISLTIDRDGISSALTYPGERISMRHHNMWKSAFGPGAMLSRVFGSNGAWLMQDRANELRRTPLPRCEYPGEWLWATPRSGLTLFHVGQGALRVTRRPDTLVVALRPPRAGAS
jgi:hypothetical protein